MNCPTRVDPEALPNGWNQNPDAFAAMRSSSINSTANKAKQRSHRIDPQSHMQAEGGDHDEERSAVPPKPDSMGYSEVAVDRVISSGDGALHDTQTKTDSSSRDSPANNLESPSSGPRAVLARALGILRKFTKFVGPGWMVSVAYIDPGEMELLLHGHA